jgi:putative ABC transport system permease protein
MRLFHRQEKHERTHSAIRPQILISIALKNLLSKRLRTFLTMTGIVIGVGAIVFLVSLAIGLHGVVNQQVLGSKSIDTIDVTTPNSLTILLNDTNTNKISQFAHVTKVAKAYILPGQISYQGSQSNTVVYGTTNDYITLSALKFVAGAQHLANSNDAIVNTALLDLIGQSNAGRALNKELAVTATITSADGSKKKEVTNNLDIVGVVNTGSGAEVYMNSQTLRNEGATQYGQLKVTADSRNDVPVVRQQIEGLGLTTASPLDTLDQINTIFTIFTFVVAGFGGIGMIIAVLGMFNMLTISLLERTSEIGLMVTMGARKADVQRLLIFEALLLSVGGGIAGIFFAWLLGQIINGVLTHFATDNGVYGTIHAFSITPPLVLYTVILIISVGLLVAFYPSRRAARINPIDALRHE